MDNQPKESRLEEFITAPKKAMWKLALPMTFGMAVQVIYMLADTAFVGRMIGGTALAALGYVFPFLFIIMGITFGVGSGATTVIAQFIGAKDKKNADNAAEHAILIGLIIGIIIVFIGFYYGDKLLEIQGADSETIHTALDYFYIMVGGSLFMVLPFFFRSILAGEGEITFPMIILAAGTILNIILDPILIYYYNIAGAAMATVISQIIVTLVFIYYLLFRNRSYVTINLKVFRYNFDIIREIFRLGIPASLSMIIMSMGVMLFNTILGSANAVAAYQTAGRIEHLFFLPIISIATALVTLVGMFYGAKRMDLITQIVKYGMTWAVVISFLFSLLFFFFSQRFIPIFIEDTQIVNLTLLYFKIMAFSYPFIAIGMTSSRVMQGMGHANPLLILTLLRVVIISASLAWYFVKVLNWPIYYAWVGILISCVVTSFVALTWLWIIIRRSLKPALLTE